MSQEESIGLGVIGCGGFGLFALQQFVQHPAVRLVGIAGTHREAARAAARRFGLGDVEEVDVMLQCDDVDMVYIATPPFLHGPQALQALRAGKHVLVEKPLAISVEQAETLIFEAQRRDLLLAVNMMQRYNPVFDQVRALIDSRLLGACLYASFENCASDENLPADHWFWNRQQSGGIFVEHGVHFFDLFAGWLGAGTVTAGSQFARPGTHLIDQVQCAGVFGTTCTHFYHGFHQAGRMDRQVCRLVFEQGDITLREWIPRSVTMDAVVDEAQTRAIVEYFPGCRLDVLESYAGPSRQVTNRGCRREVWQRVQVTWEHPLPKLPLYCELLRRLITDQIAWIRDRSHRRRVSHEHGLESLRLACQAQQLADQLTPSA
ncbi:MAG: hypothetical protein KatS3mg111_2265 [Pirellulaceae bacterium]|nr:MAG: hypothetical protein KatS3mg111_2265 [Pirellulaceae bacterium]